MLMEKVVKPFHVHEKYKKKKEEELEKLADRCNAQKFYGKIRCLTESLEPQSTLEGTRRRYDVRYSEPY